MRIISASLALCFALAGAFAQPAMASGDVESNETQTKFKIQNSLNIEKNIFENRQEVFLAAAPENFEGYLSAVKTEEELAREKALARFEQKRQAAILPKGEFIVNASAYTAAADECGKSDGITASGLKVKEKETLACPPQFPFGTKIEIKGMGTYVCQDRGGAIKGNHVDIYMETKAEAFAFGRRNLSAEIIR